jgi:hypothetical protein
LALQVSTHSVDRQLGRSSRILIKDEPGAPGRNKPSHFRPEITWVGFASLCAGNRSRLAGRASREEAPVARPPAPELGETEAADSCEEVDLLVGSKVIGRQLPHVLLEYVAWRQGAVRDSCPQHVAAEGVVVGVDNIHLVSISTDHLPSIVDTST